MSAVVSRQSIRVLAARVCWQIPPELTTGLDSSKRHATLLLVVVGGETSTKQATCGLWSYVCSALPRRRLSHKPFLASLHIQNSPAPATPAWYASACHQKREHGRGASIKRDFWCSPAKNLFTHARPFKYRLPIPQLVRDDVVLIG